MQSEFEREINKILDIKDKVTVTVLPVGYCRGYDGYALDPKQKPELSIFKETMDDDLDTLCMLDQCVS